MDKIIRVSCLWCHNNISIPKYINTDDYDGEITCKKCQARTAIKFDGSPKPKKYKVVKDGNPLSFPLRVIYEKPSDINQKVRKADTMINKNHI